MHRCKCNAGDGQCATARNLPGLQTRMNCACVQGSATVGAELSRALFHRVECEGQPPAEAARALGLGQRDGAYLLAGLRRDVAMELVATLLAELRHCGPGNDANSTSER